MSEDLERGAEGSMEGGLEGQVVAVPESRQLDILSDLLQRRGAKVLRVPLVSILDAPDPAPVERWLREFVAEPPHHFIILTGEGLRRLQGFAERAGMLAAYTTTLAKVHKICRGPKPGRVLREMDLKPEMLGKAPTTAGIIEALDDLELEGRRVAVQLYGEDPNQLLMDYLRTRGARVSAVAPYVYAPNADEEKVLDLLARLREGGITMMTFTSQPQLKRMQDVARRSGAAEELIASLNLIKVAAVGPVVAEQLREAGVRVAVMPESLYFMKPMVTELVRLARSGQ